MSAAPSQYDQTQYPQYDDFQQQQNNDYQNCLKSGDENKENNEMGEFPNDAQEFDSEIRKHLDELNRFATKINQLEKCFEDENSKFQKSLNESSINLKKLLQKCGVKYVNEARPYYDAQHKLKCLQNNCQIAAIKFEKYNEVHLQAKQCISDTELMFHKEMREDDKRDDFDQFWQEKLNIANMKFTDAKVKSKQYEDEHMRVMAEFRNHESKLSELYRKHKNSIKRTKFYFDEARIFDLNLRTIKENIQKLESELVENKNLYSQALKNLENISEVIHERRAQIITKSLKREPGVGAELTANNCSESGYEHFDEIPKSLVTDLEEKLKVV